MIQLRTKLVVADNTGAREIWCFKILGGTGHRYGQIGDIVTANVKVAEPNSQIKKGEVVHAVIVRQRRAFRRKDGSYIKFDDNAAVIITRESKEMKGTRIFGPVPSELRELGYQKIVSLAPEVL